MSKNSEPRIEGEEVHLTTFSSRSVLVGWKPARHAVADRETGNLLRLENDDCHVVQPL